MFHSAKSIVLERILKVKSIFNERFSKKSTLGKSGGAMALLGTFTLNPIERFREFFMRTSTHLTCFITQLNRKLEQSKLRGLYDP